MIIWGTWMDARAFYMRRDVRRRMKQDAAGTRDPAASPVETAEARELMRAATAADSG